jgi:hypothetical protein
MMRRLLFILIAATQIAALPLTIDPPTVEIGTPVTLSISLPTETTKLVGFPDLGSFALLEPPVRKGTILTIKLLPLRPGEQTIPPFPFQTGQRLESTTTIRLSVEAPIVPESAHPLRPLPEATDQTNLPWKNIVLIAGFATLALLLTAGLRYRRQKTIEPEYDLNDRFAQLDRAVQQAREQANPDWDNLCRQLDRSRFAPLPQREDELQELTAEFLRLRGETV